MPEAANCPVRDTRPQPFGPAAAEIEATLHATTVGDEALDAVMAGLEGLPGVAQVFWNPGPGG